MHRRLKSLFLFATCVAAAPLAEASLVTNGSFETNVVAVDTWEPANVELAGWTVNDSESDGGNRSISLFNGTFFGANITDSVAPGTNSAFEGNQYLAFNSFQGDGLSSISQDLTTEVGKLYTVQFSIAHAFPGGPHSVTVDAGGINSLSPVATLNAWTTHSFDFVATSTTTTLLISDNLGAGVTTDSDLLVDAVSVTLVPEPGSLAIAAVGLGLIVQRRRRR